MAVNSILPPYPSFFDADGLPLEAGKIYVGQPGLEAQSSPKASYYDEALTIPTGTDTGASVLTQAGFPVRNGSAAMIYCDGDFSITVRDRNDVLVYSALNRTLAFDIGGGSGQPVQVPDGNFAEAGLGFIDEVDTGLVRGGAGLVQHIVKGNVIYQVSETGVEFLLPPSGTGFVAGVAASLNQNLKDIAAITAVEGDMIYRNGTVLTKLAKGGAGQVLRQNDGLTAPEWRNAIISRTEQPTTTGTVFNFTDIPSWVRRITVQLDAVSLSTPDNFLVQVGVAAGFISAGYVGGSFVSTGGGGGYGASSAGFLMATNSAGEDHSGHMTLTRLGIINTWISSHTLGSNTRMSSGGGSIALAGALTQLRVTRDGAGTFDGGSVSIIYE